MTIIIGYEDKEGSYLATDSFGFSGGTKYDCGSKIINKKNYSL